MAPDPELFAGLFRFIRDLLRFPESKAADAASMAEEVVVDEFSSPAEAELLAKLKTETPKRLEFHLGGLHGASLMEFSDGTRVVDKVVGKSSSLSEREAFRSTQKLGWRNLVPTTVAWESDDSVTHSVQMFVSDASRSGSPDVSDYSVIEQHRAAACDYYWASVDRHPGNYLTGSNGSLILVDNELSDGYAGWDIQSDFVAANFGVPLHADVIKDLRSLDLQEEARRLRSSGFSDEAIEGR
ncbi:MAG: hypothetical protein ACRDNZ_15720, partial [Streptosporangiaceae bacterium]